jgi:hypothetical protein
MIESATFETAFDLAMRAERQVAVERYGARALRDLSRSARRVRIPWEERLQQDPLVPEIWRGRALPGRPLWQCVEITPHQLAQAAVEIARQGREALAA